MQHAALTFPDIDEVIFSIGPFDLRWYALSYIAGLIFAWFYTKRLVSNQALWPQGAPVTRVQVDDLLFWGALGVFLGGRIGYVLVYNPVYYLHHPLSVLAVWSGGMSFHGGFTGVILAVLLYCRVHKLAFFSTIDAVACGVPIGLFFGRIANFINQELYGGVTDVPWAVIFPKSDGLPRHPSQLYEAALEGILLFVVIRICSHTLMRLERPGYISGVFALVYGLSRMAVELVRLPDKQIGYLTGFLTMGMALSIPMVLLGIFLMMRARPVAA